MMKIFCLFLVWICSLSALAENYAWADRRARNAPASVAETPQKLVAYLTNGLTDDAQKARALAAWIVYHVDRDGYRHRVLIKYANRNQEPPPPIANDTFQTRIGTPADYADLFAQLAALAGLKTATIDGYAGEHIRAFRYQGRAQAVEVLADMWGANNYTLERYRARWNAVQINDEWRLLDTYWMNRNRDMYAALNIQTEQAMQRFLQHRKRRLPGVFKDKAGKKLDDRYFLADPTFMIQTHFPLETRWQLLPVPVTWATFTDQ